MASTASGLWPLPVVELNCNARSAFCLELVGPIPAIMSINSFGPQRSVGLVELTTPIWRTGRASGGVAAKMYNRLMASPISKTID
jgi:hypothetical protein